jgi:hypothetical protein
MKVGKSRVQFAKEKVHNNHAMYFLSSVLCFNKFTLYQVLNIPEYYQYDSPWLKGNFFWIPLLFLTEIISILSVWFATTERKFLLNSFTIAYWNYQYIISMIHHDWKEISFEFLYYCLLKVRFWECLYRIYCWTMKARHVMLCFSKQYCTFHFKVSFRRTRFL